MPNTPGAGGYLLAWVASVLAFSAALGTLAGGLGMTLLVAVYASVCSVPFAVVGILLVHFGCRGVRSQAAHVAAAGLAGAVSAIVLVGPYPEALGLALVLGSATAFGRLVVVPLVWRRRDSAASAARC
ncbi:hypothetical protein [Pimelobacter sp. 30-1]|uniref:hypothetical protein n=1 Tax=Pimelobacter sp. 30-1 TaxID=2004991 RepID=UPI001C0443CA|nr:hypothetical protein [Pimelobacter sp. 30-1]